MTGTAPAATPELERELERKLARGLEEALGRHLTVTVRRREASPFATVFPAEVLTVALGDGEELSVFVKHFGDQQLDHPEKQRRDREVRVYQELLADEGLPAPRCYGHSWDVSSQTGSLFLEYVDDWNLKYQGPAHWFTAARRLARLHAHFAADPRRLLGHDFLLRFDLDFFLEWAERALSAVRAGSPELGDRLRRVIRSYDRLGEVIGSQPLTLVHNDLSPKNVLADRSSVPSRICFIDWEMAGAGCGLLDLVHLKYGLDAASDAELCAAYCAELGGTGILPPSRRELSSALAACELHKTVYRLAFSATWRLPPERVAEWVCDAERFAARL